MRKHRCFGECCINCCYSRDLPKLELPDYLQAYAPKWYHTKMFCFAGAEPIPTYENQYSCIAKGYRWTNFTDYNNRYIFMLANEKAEEFYSSEEGKPRTRIQVGSYDIHYHCLLLIVEIQDIRIIEPIAGYDPIACHEEWELHSADLYGLVTRDGLWESERLAAMTDREIAQEHVARCKAFLGSWYNR